MRNIVDELEHPYKFDTEELIQLSYDAAEEMKRVRAATIEECAQIVCKLAGTFHCAICAEEAVAAIRALVEESFEADRRYLEARADKYGVALMMISEGAANPADLAARVLASWPRERPAIRALKEQNDDKK